MLKIILESCEKYIHQCRSELCRITTSKIFISKYPIISNKDVNGIIIQKLDKILQCTQQKQYKQYKTQCKMIWSFCNYFEKYVICNMRNAGETIQMETYEMPYDNILILTQKIWDMKYKYREPQETW